MNDTDVERALTAWLSAEAGALRMPTVLRERVAGIPAASGTQRRPLLRKIAGWGPVATGTVAAAASVVLATTLLNPFGDPPGAEGETCGNRQVHEALDRLRTASGYRYVSRDQVSGFDPDVEVSIEDPQFVWTDAWVTEGAYLAPDRYRETVTFHLEAMFNRGYEEMVHIAVRAWERRIVDGEAIWVETLSVWPTANVPYGHVAATVPEGTVRGVASIAFGEAPIPSGLPGVGGCTAAAPFIQEPVDWIVAVRVAVDSGRVMSIYLGPPDADATRNDYSTSYEITWEEPDPAEFEVPAEFVPAEAPGAEPPPTPSSTPFTVDPSAWPSIELPTAGQGVSASVSAVAAGAGRFVAVGSQMPLSGEAADEGWTGVVWISSDGASWQLVEDPGDLERLSFVSIGSDGSKFVAIAYRSNDDGSFIPETWSSSDGLSWEAGERFDDGTDPGDIPNVDRLAPGGPGWVATGSVWTGNVQRPALYISSNGVEWTRAELPGAGYGTIRSIVTLEDGSLVAFGCESPEETNTVPIGQTCFTRPWHSEDGTSWAPGEIQDEEIDTVIQVAGGYLAVGSAAETGQRVLYESTDAKTWQALPPLPTGERVGVDTVLVTSSGLFAKGMAGSGDTHPYAGAWRSPDEGRTWEPIALGFPEGASGTQVTAMIETPSGLVLIGYVHMGEMETRPSVWVEPAD